MQKNLIVLQVALLVFSIQGQHNDQVCVKALGGCFQNSQQVVEYNKYSLLQYDWAMDSLRHYAFNGHERIIDIGCGDGKITAAIAQQIPKGTIIGLDLSPAMLQFAVKNHAAENRHLFFVRGDATEIPFYQQFDIAVSFCCLHWVRDQKKALESIQHCLIPGGKIFLVIPGKSTNNISYFAELLISTDTWRSYFTDFVSPRIYYDAQEYTQLLQEVGFTHVAINEVDTTTTFDNQEDLTRWVCAISPHVNFLPENMQTTFLAALIDLILQHNPVAQDGTITLDAIKLEVTSNKP